MKARKVYDKILAGSRNVRFEDVCQLAEAFGFNRDRISGSHHIYRHTLGLMLNLQPGPQTSREVLSSAAIAGAGGGKRANLERLT